MTTYTEWLKRPESERNAEAATVVMGWFMSRGKQYWLDAPDGHVVHNLDWSPCTDRNATDVLLAQLRSRPLSVQFRFDDALSSAIGEDKAHDMMWLEFLSLPPSMLAWAAREACRGGEA